MPIVLKIVLLALYKKTNNNMPRPRVSLEYPTLPQDNTTVAKVKYIPTQYYHPTIRQYNPNSKQSVKAKVRNTLADTRRSIKTIGNETHHVVSKAITKTNRTVGRKTYNALPEPILKSRSNTNTNISNNNSKNIRVVNNGLNSNYYYHQKGSKIIGIEDKYVERNPNNSPTSTQSEALENQMYTALDRNRVRNNYRTKPFDVPYGDRTIKIRVGKNAPLQEVSVNALDTIAKYAGVTNTPIQTAIGLSQQETGLGRIVFFNFDSNGVDTRALGNSNYFKNFGSIPQEYLFRDFRYNNDLQDGDTVSLSTPPAQHALEYFKSGNYNRGDKNHTKDVERVGNEVWNETTGNLHTWWNTEGKKHYYRK